MTSRLALAPLLVALLFLPSVAQQESYSWDYTVPHGWTKRVDKSVLHLFSADADAMALITRVPDEGSLQDSATHFARSWMGKDRSEKILATDILTIQGDTAVRVTFTCKPEKPLKKVW